MEVTLNIDDALMERVRAEAARRETTVSALIEAGLRHILDEELAPMRVPDQLPPLPTWNGGAPRVDVADRDAVAAAMGGEEPPEPV